MAWKTLDDMDLNGKRVLCRVDINVPVENGHVTDATRIERIVPTVQYILEQGGTPILIAHFGRPKGKVALDLSLRVVVPALSEALGRKVRLIETLEAAEAGTDEIAGADVLLLENIRFYPGEEKNDPAFAERLAALGDVYCNDAFSAAHRAHASTEALARLLPACAGRLMQAELQALESALSAPERPVGAVVGGAKVSTKIDLLQNLVQKLDILVIGGGMANTFLAAMGADMGASLREDDLLDTARAILDEAKTRGCRVILPVDGRVVLDAGDAAVVEIVTAFETLKTLIWNGPLGAFEIAPFDTATVAAAQAAAKLTRDGALVTVAGGGDTVAALNQAGAADDFTYISTAGGAFLEWMEGKELPGVAALS